LTIPSIANIIEQRTTPVQRSRTNGGIIEFIFEGAKQALDASIDENDPSPSIILEKSHVIAGCATAPVPPPPQKLVGERKAQ